jgi:RNA polymerase sigma-70 factor (ECF subfamily)
MPQRFFFFHEDPGSVNTASGDTISGLLERARGGDRAALDRLFEVCRNYVAIVARSQVESWVGGKFDPSDLVQQTLLEAYRGFDKFQGRTGGEWLGWLRGILCHNAVDFARRYCAAEKRQVRREISLAQPGDDSGRKDGWAPVDSGQSPSQVLLAQERELLVSDALAHLNADQREVVVLRNLQGLPFDEVARRMNRSRPAAQMLWMRAIQNLKNILQQEASSVG